MPWNGKAVQKQVDRESRSVKEHIEELRGKIHLLTKDFEACRDRTKEKFRETEQRIAQLRAQNRSMRVQLVKHENGDHDVIMQALREEGKECGALRRATALNAMVKLDETVCQGTKNLNQMHYERSVMERKHEALQDEFAGMMVDEQMVDIESPTVSNLENALDKALIKCETGRTIGRKYSTILERLKEENLMLPGRLSAMEDLLKERKNELNELKQLDRKAHEVRQEAKNELVEQEVESFEQKKNRDIVLNNMRKEVEQRKVETEKVLRRALRTNNLLGERDSKNSNDTARYEQQEKLLLYEDLFSKIKEATRVTSATHVMDRIINQDNITDGLKNQVKELDQVRKRLIMELSKMKQDFHESKFSGDTKLSRAQMRLEELTTSLNNMNQREQKVSDECKSAGGTLVKVRNGINRLFEQLRAIRLRPPYHKCPQGDMFAQLNMVKLKLEQLTKDLGTQQNDPDVLEALHTHDFQTFLSSQLSKNNVRVSTAATNDIATAYTYDSNEENEEMLTRADIKLQCQRLVDSFNKPRKRKGKKKS